MNILIVFVFIFIIKLCFCEINWDDSAKSDKKIIDVIPKLGLRAEICVCQPVDLCSTPSSNDGAVNLDIRIVTPAAGSECEPGAVYCCFSGPPDCGLRNNNLTNPTHLAPGQAKFGEFPWHALIVNLDNDYVGGGVIIDAHRIITAAHKISSLDKSQLVVRVGDWDVQSENELYPHLDTRVTSVSVHPQYNVETLGYDVAILTLSQRLRLYPEVPHINSICLPSTAMNFTSKRCWVSGWGKDMFGAGGSYQSIQKAVDVTVLSGNQCEQQLRQTRLGRSYTLDQHSFLCAGGEKDKDACTGDGGSPLVCEGEDGRWWLAGLVAWGVGCALPRVPGVYVNLANMVPWIQQHILPAVHHLVYLH